MGKKAKPESKAMQAARAGLLEAIAELQEIKRRLMRHAREVRKAAANAEPLAHMADGTPLTAEEWMADAIAGDANNSFGDLLNDLRFHARVDRRSEIREWAADDLKGFTNQAQRRKLIAAIRERQAAKMPVSDLQDELRKLTGPYPVRPIDAMGLGVSQRQLRELLGDPPPFTWELIRGTAPTGPVKGVAGDTAYLLLARKRFLAESEEIE